MQALALSLALVVVDQWTKLLVRQHFALGESWPVHPRWFHLTYLRNTGAVWGLFQHQNEWLIGLSLAVLVGMAVFYRALVDGRGVHRLAMGCLAGGVLGNLVDRVKLGYVTDFLDLHWAGYHWPAFNVADAAICTGVAIYAVAALRHSAGLAPARPPAAALPNAPHAGPSPNS